MKECEKPGFTCYSCWNSLLCIDDGDGDFLVDFQECPPGTTCQESTGQCGTSTHYECDDDGHYAYFNCHAIGVFPDPFNCRKYYMCNKHLVHLEAQCSNEYAFDPSTNRCTRKIKDMDRCLSPVPVCHNSSQIGPIEGNPNTYYRCKRVDGIDGNIFVPELYACLDNQYFNGVVCVDITPDVEDQNGNCLKEGNFYYPNNCAWYRECPSRGSKPVTRSCPDHNKFDPKEGKCIPLECSNCKS